MKTNTGIILSIVLTHVFFSCNQKPEVNGTQDLSQTVWTSIVVNDICVDTLRFHENNLATYYACEYGWAYDATYSIHGDSVEIGINTAQLDVKKYDPHNSPSKYRLKIKGNELEWLKIEHYTGREFEEVGQEIYDNLNNFKKE